MSRQIDKPYSPYHEAELHLRKPENPDYLYVIYQGCRRKLFLNEKGGPIGIVKKGCTRSGTRFNDWSGVTKILMPEDIQKVKKGNNARLIKKYKREAAKATFTNPFIRNCLAADENKCPYENNLSTGSSNEGKIISLQSIRNAGYSFIVEKFSKALKDKIEYSSSRFPFRGYECTLSISTHRLESSYTSPGDVIGYLSLEYKDCGNGYYYLLINEEKFIGYDKD